MPVAKWLEELGLDQCVAAFKENAIDMETLPDLTDADLASIGILLGHRKKILKAASQLAAPPSSDTENRLPMNEVAGQRRQVTVLFADLSGFTRLSATFDPEETHRLLNSYFDAIDAIIENYGGIVDKHIGDCVMAVFGAPVAHSDDPERALRASEDIHRAMQQLTKRLSIPLTAHIGIASGQVVASNTGSDRHVEYTVTGDTVNLASRLDDLAEPGETLVSDAVHRTVDRIADFTSRGKVNVQGLDAPVPVWSFERIREEALTEQLPKIVGRNSELRQLRSLAEGVLAEQSGQIVLLRGEAGIGKTRLVGEFVETARAQGFTPHLVHIVDFGSMRGPRVMRDLVSNLLGLASNVGQEERYRLHHQIITQNLIGRENAVFLYDLLDLPQPEDLQQGYAAMPSSARLSGIRGTLGSLVAVLSSQAPRLIVVEDVHWAEESTLDALTGLAADLSNCPTMLILTSRLEGWTLSHNFVASLRGCPLTAVELQPLRQQDAIRLASALAQESDVDLARLVERADGNPLFLEQMVRDLSHDQSGDLPDTIHALVLTRTDRLPELDRSAIMAASILGNRFDLAVLRDLIGSRSYDCESLIKHRLMRVEGDEHVFCHALIREGVIASILRDRRRELHLRAAEYYRDCDLTLHAEHLDCADAPEAGSALLAAAREQAARIRYETALQLAKRGAEIACGAELYGLNMLLGDLAQRLGKTSEMIEAYRSALACAADGPERCRSLIGVAEAQRIVEAYDELLDTLASALCEAEAEPLPNERARISQLQGGVHFVRGDMEACLAENSRSLDLARAAGSRELEAQAQGNLGDAEFAAGRMISARERFDQCISLSREHGLENVIAANRSMRGQSLLYLCRPQEALLDSEAALELARNLFNPRAEVVALLVGVYILELTDSAAARNWALIGIEAASRIGATRFEHVFREYLGRIAAIEGDHTEAEQQVATAVEYFRQSGSSMRFLGDRALGSFALVSLAADRRRSLLREGERLLVQGVGAHNPLWFYRDAIEVSLDLADWDEAQRYARCLETYTSVQPLPWSHFFAERGHALARAGRGEATTTRLQAIGEEARAIGFTHTLARIEEFL